MVAGVEQLDRARRLHLAVGGDRVDVVLGVVRERGRGGLGGGLLPRLGLGSLTGAAVTAVAGEQATAQRPALGAVATATGHLERSALANPALMGGPRRAQLTHLTAGSAGQIRLGV